MIKDYYLIDTNHGSKEQKMASALMVLAQVSVKYGLSGLRCPTENQVREFWPDKTPYPTNNYFHALKFNRLSFMKTVIHDKIVLQDNIWNNDFIHGITMHGKLRESTQRYPVFNWVNNDHIYNLLKLNPYYGNLTKGRLGEAPVLCTNYLDTGVSFMAGVMAGGIVTICKGNNMVKYQGKSIEYLNQWHIPIEVKEKKERFISPIWPALFSKWMPNGIGDLYCNLPDAYNAQEYAAILWKTYMGDPFITKKIPYLPCRRKIYQLYKTISALDRLRVTKGLTELDNRIRDAVQILAKQ